MKRVKYIIVALFAAISSVSMAQTAASAYFLDGTYYNYKLNPAMKAERGYLSLPIGNISFGTKGNIGLANFLYPTEDGKLATFMSGKVSQDDFLGGLPDYARLGFEFENSLLGVGFRMFGGYTSLGISMHSSLSMMLPKGFFEFAKKGLQEDHYSFSGININTMNYAAFTLGYSHDIFKGFRLGVNAKYLVGLAHADITVDKLNVEFSEDRWMVESHARAQAALYCEANVTMDEENVINGFQMGSISTPDASGFGVDLGVTYDMNHIVPGLTLSASVVDLGYIKWNHMMKAQSTDAKVEFDGFDEIDYNSMDATLEKELETLGTDAAKMIEFNYEGSSSQITNLNPTMYLGLEYNMPFYKRLSVGAMYSKRFSTFDCFKTYQARGYVNLSPLKWLEASVNYGYTTYGQSFGWLFNIHVLCCHFFVGSDYMITKVTPQYIPVNDLNSHITFGLTMPLGKRK